MPKKAKKSDQEKAENKAIWKTTTLFIVFGALIFAMLWWARTNNQSEVAWKIRHLLGIELLQPPAPETAPEPVATAVEPESDPEPELEPELEPFIVEEPPAPEPDPISWPTFQSRSNLWPDSLKITVDQEITLTYHGNTYGEVTFKPGQVLDVIDLSENGYIYGRVGGNEMEVHVSATDFNAWFEKKHGELYEITTPEKETIERADDFKEELITELRIWCLKNYNTPLIAINEDNLVLKWHSRARGESEANYSLEALSVARAYLRIQAKLGGKDNYASCEIRDPDTGKLMGSKGIFIPRF